MSESLFRLLEIIAILLPLTGIFIQLTFQMTDELTAEGEESNEPVLTLRLALLTAGLSLGIAGVVGSWALYLLTDGYMTRVAILGIYVAFLLFSSVFGALWLFVHPKISVWTTQQDLSDASENNTDE